MQNMSEPIGFCVVGAGAIAERHLQAYHELGGIRPRWVVSQPVDSAQEFAERWKFSNIDSSIEPALQDPDVKLVLIASPSPLHAEHAIQAIRAGKDVIVEIPVALSWYDAQNVSQIAKDHGRRVWVCHTLRSTPAMRLVRNLVREGRLHLTHIAGFFGIPRRRNQGMGGVGIRAWIDNLLWHHGCHQIDASLWMLGMPAIERVVALFGPDHPKFGMTLDVGVQMIAAGGALITHALSYNVEQPVWQLQFIGHEDTLTFHNGRLTNEAGDELVPEKLNDLSVQNRELLHAFRTQEASEYDLASILPTMEILGRAQQSAENKGNNR